LDIDLNRFILLKKIHTSLLFVRDFLKAFIPITQILRSKADFWMICGRPGMEPNIALILNRSQAPIGMYWSKLGVFLFLPSMALEMS
jgi:hypothetical protein